MTPILVRNTQHVMAFWRETALPFQSKANEKCKNKIEKFKRVRTMFSVVVVVDDDAEKKMFSGIFFLFQTNFSQTMLTTAAMAVAVSTIIVVGCLDLDTTERVSTTTKCNKNLQTHNNTERLEAGEFRSSHGFCGESRNQIKL